MQLEKFYYDNRIVRAFGYATVIFGVVGMLAGLYAAVQIYLPQISMNFGPTTFGRVRPLHTNAIIFAFVGNATFAGVYYSLQRLCNFCRQKLRKRFNKHIFVNWMVIGRVFHEALQRTH